MRPPDWSRFLWPRLEQKRRAHRAKLYKAGVIWKSRSWDKSAANHILPVHIRKWEYVRDEQEGRHTGNE